MGGPIHQILDLLPKIGRSVVELEKEKRGYLLTGDNNCVEAYRRRVTAFTGYHGCLSILVANAPEQSALLSEIRTDLDRWSNTSATPEMVARRASRDVASLATTDNGEALMPEIRSARSRKMNSPYELRAAAASRQRIVNTTALAVLCLLAVGLLVVSNSYNCVLVRRQLCKLDDTTTVAGCLSRRSKAEEPPRLVKRRGRCMRAHFKIDRLSAGG